jgi:hypothetical protein
MKQKKSLLILFASGCMAVSAMVLNGCSKDDDVDLPPIGGYNNSDEVAATNLVGYWGFEGNGNEGKTGTAPTYSTGVTFGSGGVKGQGATFTNGVLYYASNLAALASNQPFTISFWVQVKNTGSSPTAPTNKPYMFFQMARPNDIWGNVNIMAETGQFSYLSDTLFLKALYKDPGGGLQDAVTNYGVAGTDFQWVKKAGTGQWINVVTVYNPAGGPTSNESIFQIYADSVHVSNVNFENRHAASFTFQPGEVIIGGWYNNIPNKAINADDWTVPFNGKMDEIRVWKKALTPAEISAIYQLGKAGR